MILFRAARSGDPSAQAGTIQLHSAYDPRREAQRFVEHALGASRPSCVLLLGEALGYASEALRAQLPGVRVLAIFYAPELAAASLARAPAAVDASWSPQAPEPLLSFLRNRLEDFEAPGLRILEWAPSAAAFPELARAANVAARQAVHELTGTLRTTAAFGRLWVRNTFANFVSLGRIVEGAPAPTRRPIVIAASGPSLEESGRLLQAFAGRYSLWALPSALLTLRSLGLQAELTVLTDAGYYGMFHRSRSGDRSPLALPLAAAQGGGHDGAPVLLLSQPYALERELLRRAGHRTPLVPPQGTVAATALQLALATTQGPVILAGLDLCHDDLRSHARPNAFEAILSDGCGRLSPLHGRLYERARSLAPKKEVRDGRILRTSTALEAYQGWFESLPRELAGRLFRLAPVPFPLNGFGEMSAPLFAAACADLPGPGHPGFLRPALAWPPFPVRKALAAAFLSELRLQAQALEGAAPDASLPDPSASPFGNLLAFIAPLLLSDTRREARASRGAPSVEKRRRLASEALGFLETLSRRIDRTRDDEP